MRAAERKLLNGDTGEERVIDPSNVYVGSCGGFVMSWSACVTERDTRIINNDSVRGVWLSSRVSYRLEVPHD